jgi:hypothetical protein
MLEDLHLATIRFALDLAPTKPFSDRLCPYPTAGKSFDFRRRIPCLVQRFEGLEFLADHFS